MSHKNCGTCFWWAERKNTNNDKLWIGGLGDCHCSFDDYLPASICQNRIPMMHDAGEHCPTWKQGGKKI